MIEFNVHTIAGNEIDDFLIYMFINKHDPFADLIARLSDRLLLASLEGK